MKLCAATACTGCAACLNICPKQCISMEEGLNGHLFPVCNEADCINCGLCEKVCPVNTDIEKRKPMATYAAWNTNLEVQKKSTSGGISAMLAKAIVEEQGIVYGAAFDKNWSVVHIRCETLEDLDALRTSKYVQSKIGDTYKRVQSDLKANKRVMFVGTPCQVAGLKSFLRADYEKLYTADLVCHGVPSDKIYREELAYLADTDKLKWVYFRGWFAAGYGYGFIFDYGDRTEKFPLRQSYYIRGFMDGLFFRKSCYSCRYATKERLGDITIGDFWGIGKSVPFNNPEKRRVSLALINTEKGRDWFDAIKADLHFEERELMEAVNGNPQLRKPIAKPEQYEKFKKLYPSIGYLKAMQRTFPKMRIRLLLEKILRKKS